MKTMLDLSIDFPDGKLAITEFHPVMHDNHHCTAFRLVLDLEKSPTKYPTPETVAKALCDRFSCECESPVICPRRLKLHPNACRFVFTTFVKTNEFDPEDLPGLLAIIRYRLCILFDAESYSAKTHLTYR